MTELRLDGVSKYYGSTAGSITALGATAESRAEGLLERESDGRSNSDGVGTAALRDVDLTIRDGEFFTLVGPSGCGKTTTLRTIAGFEEPTVGRVTFDGTDATDVPPDQRDVGVVFQSYALFPHMTVAENVGYGLQFRDPPGEATVDERVTSLLDLVDLTGMGDRNPDQLSGGQRQRVALARALAPAPGVLLLDEPMSALDAQLRESLRRQVKRIQRELDITTIYVTHDQSEALAISDRLAVMNDGQIEQVGTPQEIYREPATRFVAEFVGDSTVLDGSIVDAETADGTASVAVDGRTFELPALPTGYDQVSFCVRPGALTRDSDRNRIQIDVETSEFLGESVRVHGRWNGSPVILRLDDDPGDEVTVGFEPESAHVVELQ